MRPAWVLVGLAAAAAQGGPMSVGPDDPRIAWMGRVDRTDPARPRLGFPGVTIRVRFEGPFLALRAADTTGQSAFDVLVDGGEPKLVRCEKGEREYVFADGLSDAPHEAELVRRTETWQGIVTVLGLRLAPGKQLLPPPAWPSRRLLFVGDSVTAGEGVDPRPADCVKDAPRFSNARLSYGMLLARALGAQAHLVAFGGRGLIRDWQGRQDVLNGPGFFDLALPDEQASPPRFDHASYLPDAVVVSLGTNDWSASAGPPPDREELVSAYVAFVRQVRARYPIARVFLTEGALLDGASRAALVSCIEETVRRLADPRVERAEARRQPGDACDAHPTGEQHRLMAEELEPLLRRRLGW